MICGRCKADSPDGKKFCSDCGASLDPIDDKVRQAVETILKDRYRDQKLVEIETTDAVINRLRSWVRPLAYALALFLSVLGIFGFRGLRDTWGALRTAQDTAIQTLQHQAQAEVQSLSKEAQTVREQYRKLGDQDQLLRKYKEVEDQLAAMQNAGRNLKRRYESVGAELSRIQSETGDPSGAARTPDRPGPKVSMSLNPTEPLTPSKTAEPPWLAPGRSGPEVEKLQARLHDLGCYSGPVNGTFDEQTKLAVERYNTARGELFPPGVVDPEMWRLLFAKTNRCR